jgi:hypothetical protein
VRCHFHIQFGLNAARVDGVVRFFQLFQKLVVVVPDIPPLFRSYSLLTKAVITATGKQFRDFRDELFLEKGQECAYVHHGSPRAELSFRRLFPVGAC